MHTKEELENMTVEELNTLAEGLGVEIQSDTTDLIYNILDAESLAASQRGKEEAKKKAEEEAKKNGEEGTNNGQLPEASDAPVFTAAPEAA